MHPQKGHGHQIVSSLRHRKEEADDRQFALTALGRLWMSGVAVDWDLQHDGAQRYRIPLPTYPFERQRYWIEPGSALFTGAEEAAPVLAKMAEMDDWYYQRTWKPASAPTPIPAAPQTWLLFQDELGVGAEAAARLREDDHRVIVVTTGEQFKEIAPDHFEINPRARIDYDTLVAELVAREMSPERVAHFWTLNHRAADEKPLRYFYRNQDLGFFSLFFLVQALGDESLTDLHMTVFSNGMQRVGEEALPYPEKGTLLGPVQVIPREFPGMSVACVDLPVEKGGRRRPSKPSSPTSSPRRKPASSPSASANAGSSATKNGIRPQPPIRRSPCLKIR
jgi:acyl transferase domain-containing protein